MANISNRQGIWNEMTVRYQITPTRKKKKTTGVGEDVENWNLHTLLKGLQNSTATLEKSLTVLQKVKQPWLSHSTPRDTPRRNESICLHRNLYINVHSNKIPNSQRMETTQTWNNYTMGYLAVKSNEFLVIQLSLNMLCKMRKGSNKNHECMVVYVKWWETGKSKGTESN